MLNSQIYSAFSDLFRTSKNKYVHIYLTGIEKIVDIYMLLYSSILLIPLEIEADHFGMDVELSVQN